MLYMLDTDTASYILRGGYSRLDRRMETISPTDVCISVITRSELRYGQISLPSSHRLRGLLRRFLEVTHALPWDTEAADIHAEIRHQLRTTGKPIGEMDTLIAAHAIALDAVLVTNNTRHFERIQMPLKLENWTK